MRPTAASGRRLLAVILLCGTGQRAALAQTQYYNLDGGRPDRVEDAEATARYALGIDVGPFQFEHLAGGTNRYRAEPKLSYGILPFTEIEVRVPIVHVDPAASTGAHSITGVASVAVGALHAFNLETPSWPALAVGGEVTLPVGTLAGPQAAYLLKVLSTKTTSLGRIHVNLGAGTYSVRTVSASADTGACSGGSDSRFTLPGQTTCSGSPPIIFDAPCSIAPATPQTLRPNMMCTGAPPALATTTISAPHTYGTHWMAGAGVDHAFALRSTLLTADIVAERFVGLYSRDDWTAETGVRHQVTPLLMVDAGVGWHFAGIVRSTSVIFGATYELATRPLFGKRSAEH